MAKLKNDNLLLLKTLRELLVSNIKYIDISPHDDGEIADLVIELTDKRRHRKLKKLLKEFDLFIDDIKIQEKLRKDETEYNKEKRAERIRHDDLQSGND